METEHPTLVRTGKPLGLGPGSSRALPIGGPLSGVSTIECTTVCTAPRYSSARVSPPPLGKSRLSILVPLRRDRSQHLSHSPSLSRPRLSDGKIELKLGLTDPAVYSPRHLSYTASRQPTTGDHPDGDFPPSCHALETHDDFRTTQTDDNHIDTPNLSPSINVRQGPSHRLLRLRLPTDPVRPVCFKHTTHDTSLRLAPASLTTSNRSFSFIFFKFKRQGD